jgi:hypothetical protein
MFRVVVIHQLVLSLVVGPMLCCCAAARLGHDLSASFCRASNSAVSQPRGCCGHSHKTPDSRPDGGSQQPGDPSKCPCQESPAQTTAILEGQSVSADVQRLLTADLASLFQPISLDGPAAPDGPASRSDPSVSFLSTAQLLYAHHKLRC